jgi:hypothetical protein
VAQRVADELDTMLGSHVGYLIRFEVRKVKNRWNPAIRKDDEEIRMIKGRVTLWLCQNSYGKYPFIIGKSTINDQFQ